MDRKGGKEFQDDSMNMSYRSNKWLFHEILALSTLALSCAWFFRKSLTGNHSFGIWQDNEFLISPLLHSLGEKNSWLGLETYLPEFLGGLSLDSFAQFSTLYPFYFIGSALFESPISSIESLNLLIHLHLLIFSFGSYYLARSLSCSRLVAIICALFVVFNANTLNYATWLNIIAPYSWLPWILFFLIQALEKNLYRYWVFFFFTSILLLLASPAQPVIHTFFLVAFISLAKYLSVRKNPAKKKPYFSTIKKFVIGFPFFVIALSPILVPLLVAAARQIRWIGDYPPVIGFSKIPFEGFLTTQVEISEIPNMLFPPTVGREIGSVHFGPIILTLLIYGLLKLNKNLYWKTFFFIGVYCLFSSFGNNFGFAQINYHIPLINAIREPSRFLVLSHLCFGICAALGMNEAMLRLQKASRGKRLAGKSLSNGNLTTFVSVILLVIFLFTQPSIIKWQSPDISSSDYFSQNWKNLEDPINQIKELDPSGEFRVILGGEINSQKASMFLAFYGLRTLNVYLNPIPLQQFNSIYFYDNFGYRYKELLGARFLICSFNCSAKSSALYQDYKLVWSNSTYELYENENAHGFATLPKKILMSFKPQESLVELSNNKQYDSVVESSTFDKKVKNVECYFLDKRNEKYKEVFATVSCKSDGYLVISAFNDGNWKGYINGDSVKVGKANGNLVMVKLQPGINELNVKHVSTSRDFMMPISFMLIILALSVLIFLSRSKRNSSMVI